MYPQLNLAAVEGPVATFKTNKGGLRLSYFLSKPLRRLKTF